MENIIFLNNHQKRVLEESGISLKLVTRQKLEEVLTAVDYFDVMSTTNRLMSKNNILFKLGYCGDNLIEYDGQKYELDKAVLKGVCPNEHTLVIWVEPSQLNNPNDMMKQSAINLVAAMAAVMTFKQVKHTYPFKVCYLFV